MELKRERTALDEFFTPTIDCVLGLFSEGEMLPGFLVSPHVPLHFINWKTEGTARPRDWAGP